MARFHVYEVGDGYALDVQSNLLDRLQTRVMIPLVAASHVINIMSRLNPVVVVGGKTYLMSTERMASIPLSEIGVEIADLTPRSDDITAALDFLFQGF
ncbi:CcdB family protein [Rhizobium metallidurans]|uniref:Toxin CcdB n=1 Tax=Rhizobium metallidurans TaxID=1265931 RepID=A0A7W6CX33_9HYPH|nr:CcdB family protein [Rhizobium metallidurans]MBB3965255.1 toxin CcdB [Rhizobium metallidurans]